MIPKFRAWDKKAKSFINACDIVLDLISGKVYAGDIGLTDSINDVTDQIVLMQSTGLKDKNGVEIFEGDVFESGYARYVVFWQKDAARFVLKFIHDFEDSYYLDMRNIESMDLISNIYANPELLSSGIE